MATFDKYNRSNYIQIEEIDSGKLERDMLLSNWDLFSVRRGVQYAYILATEIQRPDLFSFRAYNRQDFWWIVSKVNNIDDWWNDVYIGMRISVPSILDIEDFYANVKSRMNANGVR